MIFIRPGDSEKLSGRGGHGGYGADGAAFFEWRLDWPGGDGVQVVYVEGPDHVVHRAFVIL